jgi:hypothetical protein
MFLTFGGVGLGEDLMNPSDFSHKVRKKDTPKNYYPATRIKLTIARVHDNQLVDTPFGEETGGGELAVINTEGQTVVTAKNKAHYKTRKDEMGYGKKVRQMMGYHLSTIKSIQLVEREDINAIIRELDFSDTRYVKTKGMPEVEMPQYIAKGFLTANDGSCASEESLQWNVSSEKKDPNPLMFLIRVYDTSSALVKYIACGTGKEQNQAIKKAVDNLKDHMDLLYPDVTVLEVAGQKLTLSGGKNQGLAPGTHFYLVTSQGLKAAIDYSDLDYVARCKVIASQAERATALIEETMSEAAPKIGDWVFFHYKRPTW